MGIFCWDIAENQSLELILDGFFCFVAEYVFDDVPFTVNKMSVVFR